MKTELKQMIENGEISEIEIVGFIRTLKKLGKNNFMDKRNVQLVMNRNLLDKNFILCCFEAKQKNEKSLMGVINKILK